MDRIGITIALAALSAACGGGLPSAGSGSALTPGASPHAPASGLRIVSDVARGVLTYNVALAGEHIVSAELSESFELVARETATTRQAWRVQLGPSDYDINDVTSTDDRVWVASADGTVRSFELATGALASTWRLGAAATAVAVARSGEYVATATDTGVVCLRRARDAALLQCVVGHDARISSIDFAGTGDSVQLASAAWDGTVVIWDVPSLAVSRRLTTGGSANDVAFDPSGARLAIARSGAPPRRSPDVVAAEKRGFTVTDQEAQVVIWTVTGSQISGRGHAAPVTTVAWTPDGKRVVSGSWDRTVRVWDPSSGREIARLGGFNHLVRSLSVSGNGRHVAVGAWSGDLNGRSTVLLELLYPPRR